MYRKKIGALLLLVVSAIGVYFTFLFYQVFFLPNTSFEEPAVELFIPTGTTQTELIAQLTPLVNSIENFRLAASKKGYLQHIKSGKYRLVKGMNNNELINRLRGSSLAVKVTFNNQERLENLAGRIAAQIELDSTSLLEQLYSPVFLAEKGFTKETALAMYLPNTYELFWNTTAIDFQKRMYSEYDRFWNVSRREAASAIGLSPLEVITLASIVQKEFYQSEEKSRIAGVYLNRLKRGMRLQADPTLIFAMKQTLNDYDLVIKRVLKKDLKIDSPYNTYIYRGLPPGPICMPDLSSIEAVLNPEKHNYFYFVVNPNQSGFHDFSRTLKEHNRKARLYYRWLNQRKLYR